MHACTEKQMGIIREHYLDEKYHSFESGIYPTLVDIDIFCLRNIFYHNSVDRNGDKCSLGIEFLLRPEYFCWLQDEIRNKWTLININTKERRKLKIQHTSPVIGAYVRTPIILFKDREDVMTFMMSVKI